MDKILKQKILIVEDDGHAVHKALKHLFESAGYSVEICRDGESAFEFNNLQGHVRLPSTCKNT